MCRNVPWETAKMRTIRHQNYFVKYQKTKYPTKKLKLLTCKRISLAENCVTPSTLLFHNHTAQRAHAFKNTLATLPIRLKFLPEPGEDNLSCCFLMCESSLCTNDLTAPSLVLGQNWLWTIPSMLGTGRKLWTTYFARLSRRTPTPYCFLLLRYTNIQLSSKQPTG